MKQIPETADPVVLRTDFSNQAAWEAICATIRKPVADFQAYVKFIEDSVYAGITKEQLLKHIPTNYRHTFMIVADQTTILHPDFPLLIIDLYKYLDASSVPSHRKFRRLRINYLLLTWFLRNSLSPLTKTGFFSVSPKDEGGLPNVLPISRTFSFSASYNQAHGSTSTHHHPSI
jgi:hypothetical protein